MKTDVEIFREFEARIASEVDAMFREDEAALKIPEDEGTMVLLEPTPEARAVHDRVVQAVEGIVMRADGKSLRQLMVEAGFGPGERIKVG
jgi:hypothetical protein